MDSYGEPLEMWIVMTKRSALEHGESMISVGMTRYGREREESFRSLGHSSTNHGKVE